jgi:AraC-like DNA-binding protein
MLISYQELQLKHFDPELLLHAISNVQTEHRLIAGGILHANLKRLTLGELTINTADYSYPYFLSAGTPQDMAYIGFANHTISEIRVNSQVTPVGQLQLYAPGSEAHVISKTGSGWIVFELPIERLQSAAITQGVGELEWPRQGVRYVDLPSDISQHLRLEVHKLLQFGHRFAGSTDKDLAALLLSEEFTVLLAQVINSGNQLSRLHSTLTAGRLHALDALESYIDRWTLKPSDSLKIAQITESSERMLELATRDAYGVTPHHWLKLVRLNAAYKDLYQGNCISVTQVCQQWGFNHTGRFAIEYRSLFGESPSETLRRNLSK